MPVNDDQDVAPQPQQTDQEQPQDVAPKSNRKMWIIVGAIVTAGLSLIGLIIFLTAGPSDETTVADCRDPQATLDVTKECLSAAQDVIAGRIEDPIPTPEPSPQEEVMQGLASEPATLPGGLQVRIVSATSGPADPDIYVDDATEDTLVTVTVEMTPWNEETYPLDTTSVDLGLLYGPNRASAQEWLTDGGVTDLPQQVTPGTTVTVVQDFTLPAAGLDELVLTFTPDLTFEFNYEFTDVQDVLAD